MSPFRCNITSKLAQEDHNISINNRSSRSWDGEEVEPGEGARAGILILKFLEDGVLHDEELLSVFLKLGAANAFPDVEGFESAAFVH